MRSRLSYLKFAPPHPIWPAEKATGGKANPQAVNQLVKQKLGIEE